MNCEPWIRLRVIVCLYTVRNGVPRDNVNLHKAGYSFEHKALFRHLGSAVVTVFILIECMIQLPQEILIPGIVCLVLERKPLPAIIFYESN